MKSIATSLLIASLLQVSATPAFANRVTAFVKRNFTVSDAVRKAKKSLKTESLTGQVVTVARTRATGFVDKLILKRLTKRIEKKLRIHGEEEKKREEAKAIEFEKIRPLY